MSVWLVGLVRLPIAYRLGKTTKAIIQNMTEKWDTKTGHQTGTTEKISVLV